MKTAVLEPVVMIGNDTESNPFAQRKITRSDWCKSRAREKNKQRGCCPPEQVHVVETIWYEVVLMHPISIIFLLPLTSFSGSPIDSLYTWEAPPRDLLCGAPRKGEPLLSRRQNRRFVVLPYRLQELRRRRTW